MPEHSRTEQVKAYLSAYSDTKRLILELQPTISDTSASILAAVAATNSLKPAYNSTPSEQLSDRDIEALAVYVASYDFPPLRASDIFRVVFKGREPSRAESIETAKLLKSFGCTRHARPGLVQFSNARRLK